MPYAPTVSFRNKRFGIITTTTGFTLLEILTAIFIFAIIIGLVFGSFEGVFSSADHINAVSDLYEMGNACMDRLTADLESIHVMHYPRYHPPDIDDDPDIYRVEGTLDSLGGNAFTRLRFTSLAHLPLNQDTREGIAQIVYYVQEDENDSYLLRRSDTLYPYPEFEPDDADPVVCENIRKFQLTFYTHEGEERETWDSDADDEDYSSPKMVGISLAIGAMETPLEFTTQVLLPMVRYKEMKK